MSDLDNGKMDKVNDYINEHEQETAVWVASIIKTEIDTLSTEISDATWVEKKEKWLLWNVIDWLRNDGDLRQYAELKMKDGELNRMEKFKVRLLELRLSITCPYFKDFQAFLDELKKWEYVPEPWQEQSSSSSENDDNNNNDNNNESWVETQSHTFLWTKVENIQSSPYYRNSNTWVTRCSKTARENGKRFWIVLPSWNAYDAWETPWQGCKWTLPENKVNKKPQKSWEWIPTPQFVSYWKWNYADIYVESRSNYWHRAAAFRDDSWQWYVLDPYTRVNWRLDTSPKKLEDYVKCKKIVKAHFYESRWYVPEDQEVAENPQVEKAVQRAINIAEDNCHGYEWGWKWKNWQYDCSWLVTNAFKEAWFNVPVSWTATMRRNFTAAWFEWISPYDQNNLQRWDILLKDIWADWQRHTEIYTWNWKFVWARSNKDWRSWDSSGNEIAETSANWLFNFWRNWVLRYKG